MTFLRRHRGALIFLALYLVLYATLSLTSERAGVFMPSGRPSLLPIALALTVLVMRLALLFVVLPLVVYRAISARAA